MHPASLHVATELDECLASDTPDPAALALLMELALRLTEPPASRPPPCRPGGSARPTG